MAFVHLRLHTEYSVVDGSLRVDAAAQAACADGQPALAITDLGNLFGAIKFYNACRAAGVKPLLGADVWIEPQEGEKTASRLLLLVQDKQGYLNLSELLARAWTTNVQRNQACLKWPWLQELGAGLIVLSGADHGAIGQALLSGDSMRASEMARRTAACFSGRFYLEVQRAQAAHHEGLVRATVSLAQAEQIPVVATHPVQFLRPQDFEAHEARVCIAEGETLANPRRVKRFTRDQHFKTQAQMQVLFADLPAALANSVEIARRCSLSLVLGKAQLPDFPTPVVDGQRMAIAQYFHQASHAGLERRLIALYPDEAARGRERSRYVERLEFEIATIVKMGFPGYFLIVSDFIVWAQNNGCPVGPGRGSGAGSLVAYALSITGLDPLRYRLLFERFLNPERVSMPDFDIDFCQANRERVIDYVKDKYGRDAVSQIVTFGTMAAKAALRDVGRVLGMSYGHVDSVAKLIPAPPGKTVTLAKVPEQPDPKLIYARREVPELEQREAADEDVAELLDLAAQVEGTVRNVGMHAGGVLIAPGRITDFCPLYQQPGSDSAVSQFDKDDVEAIGLVKFDFLGLATLTILELAKDFIRQRHADRADFDYELVPLDDARVYKLFAEGRSEAVFQFESRGMQGMLRDAKPTRLEDLIALNAMFRPGPMENIPSFCARKNGREEVHYPHPLLAPVLEETYGIFVYQEQVMLAAQVLAGYSLGAADILRKAMGKKQPEEMAKQRQIFREGAAVKGLSVDKANEVFDLMEKFAGYGFNKSHAAAYSVLAYHTAWVKVRYPAEFYAANMTVEMGDTDKIKVLLADARDHGVAFDPPDVNAGVFRFEPVGDARVRYGLGAVKGTGQGAIDAVVAARAAGGPFRSLFDFCARIDRQRVNKRVVEALIRAGAFDSLQRDRAALIASVGLAFDFADTQDAHALQGGLFDLGDAHGASTQEPELAAGESWGVRERLLQEKSALGFFLSGHMFDATEAEVRRFVRRRLADVTADREPQLLAGIVSDLRVVNGQRGRVAIFKLDDGTETLEAVANEDLLQAHREQLRDDELLVVQGKVQNDRFSGGLRLNVNQVWDLAGARCRFARWLDWPAAAQEPALFDLLRDHPPRALVDGEAPQGLGVRVVVDRPAARGVVDLGDQARFYPSDAALERVARSTQGLARVVYDDG